MAILRRTFGLFGLVLVVGLFGGVAYLSRGPYKAMMTINELLEENKQLKQAISNLTHEEQIGYAKVIEQQTVDGKLFTKIRFVETARGDKLKRVLEKEYTIEGDVVHFDALIIKFGSKMVIDNKSRSMYLWRRIYGEKMTPEQGYLIEQPGAEPVRYGDLLSDMSVKHKEMFWKNIWDLANDTGRLSKHDIEAIYGNVVYSKLQEGLIYIFKISPTGQITPEIVPDM
jgi:hypothetical protein